MNKNTVAVVAAMFVLVLAGNAMATGYAFEDVIDNWGPLQIGAAPIVEGCPLNYTHDINDSVDFAAGHTVVDATLTLDFTNDTTDSVGSVFGISWNFREFSHVAYDGSGWVDIGEVDNGQYPIVLDIDWLNDDGMLDVTIKVNNQGAGDATAWLDESRLTGHAVPEPITILGVLASIGGIGAYLRRRQAA